MKYAHIWLLSLVFFIPSCDVYKRLLEGSEVNYEDFGAIIKDNPEVVLQELGKMTVTAYRSVPEQTDNTPFIAADGYLVHPYGIAISRDLDSVLKFGDVVLIERIGLKVVNDRMHKRHKKHIDIWVPSPHSDPVKYEREFYRKFKGKKVRLWKLTVKGG